MTLKHDYSSFWEHLFYKFVLLSNHYIAYNQLTNGHLTTQVDRYTEHPYIIHNKELIEDNKHP